MLHDWFEEIGEGSPYMLLTKVSKTKLINLDNKEKSKSAFAKLQSTRSLIPAVTRR